MFKFKCLAFYFRKNENISIRVTQKIKMKLTETIVKFGKLIEYLIVLVLEPFIILTAFKKVSSFSNNDF